MPAAAALFFFAVSALLSNSAAAVCVPSSVSSATLEIAGDDRYWAYLNGVTLTSCTSGGGGCYKNIATLIVPPALVSLPPADNVLAVYFTDNGGVISGGTWRLSISYADCPAQVLTSDGACTRAKYAGNVFQSSGAPPVSFPPGWNGTGYDDTAWGGPWSSGICSGICATCCSAWNNSLGTPWIWGSQSFQTNYQSDGYLFRQTFRAGDPLYCPLSPAPSPTAIGTVTPGTVTPAPSPTRSFTVTATLTPTPSVTPAMPLLKTVDRPVATIGDTITYCLNWSNDSSSPRPMVLWDTLHPVLTFIGGSPAPLQNGQLLTWDFGNVAAGSSGQACFWARIDGYP